jgi:hypothetical protein
MSTMWVELTALMLTGLVALIAVHTYVARNAVRWSEQEEAARLQRAADLTRLSSGKNPTRRSNR